MLNVAFAQINATVGDLDGNARRIVQAARVAHAQGAALPDVCSACRYSCRMNGVGARCARKSAFHCAASTVAGSTWARMT